MTACWLGRSQLSAFLVKEAAGGRLRYLLRRNFAQCCQVLPFKIICVLKIVVGSWLLHGEEYMDWTPMHYACARFELSVIEYIHRHGGSLTQSQSSCGTTPMHWLGKNFRKDLVYKESTYDDEKAFLEVVLWILDNDVTAFFVTDYAGTTALECILERASLEIIRVLTVRLVCPREGRITELQSEQFIAE